MLYPKWTLLALCLATSTTDAQRPYIGAWKLIPSKSRLPDEMRIRHSSGNRYTFEFGGGAETVVADGSEQQALDSTLLSVKQDGPNGWTVRRKQNGRLLLSATWTLSNHDSTLTDSFHQFGADGSTLSVDYVYRRAGEGAGIAGDWRSIEETVRSPFVLAVKPLGDDGLSFISPFGTTKATFADGDRTIRRVDARTLLLTIKPGGKVAATEDVVLSADLKTLTLTMRIAGHDRPNVLVFERMGQAPSI